jgi:hypothetical protein
MCQHEGERPAQWNIDMLLYSCSKGIALTLWNVLATGHIRSDAEEELRRKTGEQGRTMYSGWERTPDEKKMCDALEVVAKQVGTTHISAGMSLEYPRTG